MARFICVIVAWLVATSTSAEADGLWVEVYTGERPAEADRLLEPMQAVFAERGFVGGGALSTEVVAISQSGQSVSDQEVGQLGRLVKLAYSLLSSGQYEAATRNLERAVYIANAAHAAMVRDDSGRDIVMSALLGLAIAHRRGSETLEEEAVELARKKLGAEAKSKREEARELRRRSDSILEDAVRFSTSEPDPSMYGIEPVTWWREARERLRGTTTGTLIIDPGDPGVTSFVNLGYVGQGRTKIDLPAGRYHVYSHRADVPGRVRVVEIAARKVTRVEIDWAFDAALRTGRSVWFSLDSPTQNKNMRARLAVEMAELHRKQEVVMVGLSTKADGAQYAYGVRFDAKGDVLASGEVRLGETESPNRLRSLALLLTGEGEVPNVDRFDPETAPAAWVERLVPSRAEGIPEGRSSSAILGGSALRFGTLGLAVVSSGLGVRWLVRHDQCVEQPCQQLHNTKAVGIAAISVSVTASLGAGYLWGRHRRDQGRLLSSGPALGTTVFSGGMMVVGGVLMAVHRSGSGDQKPLVLGGILASAGGAGLGFSLYSLLGTDAAPTLNVIDGGAVAGLVGAF